MVATFTTKETKDGTYYTYLLNGEVIRRSYHKYAYVTEILQPWSDKAIYEFSNSGKAGVEERRVLNIKAGKFGQKSQENYKKVTINHYNITEG